MVREGGHGEGCGGGKQGHYFWELCVSKIRVRINVKPMFISR